jgi:DHA1 family bicyclomycin/chloramphenicol resistance-like MFS transporter
LFFLGIIALILFQLFIPSDEKYVKEVKINILDYINLIKNKLVILYTITLCLVIGAYYTFVGLAPILFIEAFNVKLEYFGFYQGAITLTFGIFSLFSGKFITAIGKKVSFILSFLLICISILANILFIFLDITNPNIIISGMIMLSMGVVIPCNIMFVRALTVVPKAQGRISALIATAKWVFAIIGIQTASYFYHQSYSSIGMVVTFMVCLAIICGNSLIKNDAQLYKDLTN